MADGAGSSVSSTERSATTNQRNAIPASGTR